MKEKRFKEILKKLFCYINRPSSIQRETFYVLYFYKNSFNSIPYFLCVPKKNKTSDYYPDKKNFNIFSEEMAKEFREKKFIQKYKEREKNYYKEWEKTCKQVNKIFPKNKGSLSKSEIEIIKSFLNYPMKKRNYFYFGLSFYPFEEKIVPIYKKKLKKKFKNKFKEIWDVVTNQTELTNYQKFIIKISKLKKYYGKKIPKSEIKKIKKEYCYLNVYAPEERGLTYNNILEIYQNTEKDDYIKILNNIEKNKKNFKELLKKIENKDILEIIKQINYNVYLRTIRMEKIMKGFYLASPFYDYLRQKLRFTRTEIGNLTKEEILDFLEKNKKPERRSTFPGVLYIKGKAKILTKKEKRLVEEEFSFKKKRKILKGQSIQKSKKIKGKAKIVFSKEELNKVKKGDILISPFTRPEYTSTMRKAAAIVTDEGGITCHAAIVSRELGKPCVIGTKIATKVLKDGDYVEVDADKGIVKIIKKK